MFNPFRAPVLGTNYLECFVPTYGNAVLKRVKAQTEETNGRRSSCTAIGCSGKKMLLLLPCVFHETANTLFTQQPHLFVFTDTSFRLQYDRVPCRRVQQTLLLLRGAILNGTYVTYTCFAIFTNNIWSYYLWSRVILILLLLVGVEYNQATKETERQPFRRKLERKGLIAKNVLVENTTYNDLRRISCLFAY